ncbi:MAG: hypothetical protein PHV07_09845 [Oscillospiraceae bacterium]|nr:hypothetical protein [Oscillospiraceae bacterium]
MKRKAFTLPEILISGCIMTFVMLIGIGIMGAVSKTVFNGQTESKNRISFSDNIYYLSREIQSAEKIKISYDKKILQIKQQGSSNYLKYEIKNDTPTSFLSFQGKKMFNVDYDKSSFDKNGMSVIVTLSVLKNDRESKQTPQPEVVHITPRSGNSIVEVEHAP